MGWGFRVTCPDCRHKWAGVQTSYRFGPWYTPAHPTIDARSQSWFCSRCYFRLYIPLAIEQNVWREWYAEFLTGPDARYALLRDVAARLDYVLSRGGYSIALPVELAPVDCPGCRQPFEESRATASDRLVCPHCQRRGAVLDEFDSHLQIFNDEHGFS